jgi:uncharacterized protein YdiU (UPF0061 family)
LDETVQQDVQLITKLEQLLAGTKPDYTIFFQLLAQLPQSLDDAQAKHFGVELFGALVIRTDDGNMVYAKGCKHGLKVRFQMHCKKDGLQHSVGK